MERPADCELLGFEGEIALIIGKTARRVSIVDAWSYVGGLTASNDLGVYDLRWADKGSNLRSKGGDGFTPVGPAILNAADVDPAGQKFIDLGSRLRALPAPLAHDRDRVACLFADPKSPWQCGSHTSISTGFSASTFPRVQASPVQRWGDRRCRISDQQPPLGDLNWRARPRLQRTATFDLSNNRCDDLSNTVSSGQGLRVGSAV